MFLILFLYLSIFHGTISVNNTNISTFNSSSGPLVSTLSTVVNITSIISSSSSSSYISGNYSDSQNPLTTTSSISLFNLTQSTIKQIISTASNISLGGGNLTTLYPVFTSNNSSIFLNLSSTATTLQNSSILNSTTPIPGSIITSNPSVSSFNFSILGNTTASTSTPMINNSTISSSTANTSVSTSNSSNYNNNTTISTSPTSGSSVITSTSSTTTTLSTASQGPTISTTTPTQITTEGTFYQRIVLIKFSNEVWLSDYSNPSSPKYISKVIDLTQQIKTALKTFPLFNVTIIGLSQGSIIANSSLLFSQQISDNDIIGNITSNISGGSVINPGSSAFPNWAVIVIAVACTVTVIALAFLISAIIFRRRRLKGYGRHITETVEMSERWKYDQSNLAYQDEIHL